MQLTTERENARINVISCSYVHLSSVLTTKLGKPQHTYMAIQNQLAMYVLLNQYINKNVKGWE
uniref:Uncharacterized protein n=1 Tax=Arundo donax TaxID=35708 RepID=A0A0A9DXD8_ARUDO